LLLVAMKLIAVKLAGLELFCPATAQQRAAGRAQGES
jgi:hypothetical protein